MNIVVLDGYTENPGDLSWENLAQLGALTVYERTSENEIIPRLPKGAVLENHVFDGSPFVVVDQAD